MEFVQIFESLGVPIAMLIYFIWNTNKRDKEIREERQIRADEFKQARENYLAAEKDSLLKYAELTRHVTEVISNVQREINVLTDKVAELAAIIKTKRED